MCCLTLIELLRSNESLSWSDWGDLTADVFQRKQQKSQRLPETFRAWCHYGAERQRQWSFTQPQRRLSPLRPAAVLRGPHCSSAQPSLLHQPGIRGGEGPSVVPWPQPRMSPSLFPASDCAGVWFLWPHHAFPFPVRLCTVWGCSVCSYWKTSATVPVVTEHPTLAVCGVVSAGGM